MPFVWVSRRGAWGWTLCGIVWGLAALGLAIKLTPLARIRGLSTGSYLAMGWTVLIAIKPVLAHVPLGGVWLLLDGGLCYTVRTKRSAERQRATGRRKLGSLTAPSNARRRR